MSRFSRCPALFLCLILISLALPVMAQVSQPNTDNNVAPTSHSPQPLPVMHLQPLQHGVPWRDPNTSGAAVGFAAPAGAHLTYFGGPIISNVQVVQVLYGSGSYNAQVAGTTSPTMGNFFSDITSTGLISLMQQYNTNISGGTGQIFGNGTFGGLFQIVPAAGNNGSTISDTQIQAELLSQITAGHLPAPILDAQGQPNTLYMIYFPPGKTITQGGSSSCVAGGFCAFHGTTSSTFNSKHVLYGVMPDMQAGSGCSTGCGTSSVFGNYTSVTSHELVEAMTDAQVGIATVVGPPLAWYDQTNGEIGDICNGQQATYVANGTSYVIQLEFSNAANNCVTFPAASSPNFSLSASPSSLSMTRGSSGSSTITVSPSGGFTGSVSLSTSALPSGVTASFGTNPTTGSSVVTFTASSTATTGTSSVTITGTSGSLTHTTSISLTVNAVATPDYSLSASPSSLTVKQGTSGSSTITVTPSGGFTGSVSLSTSALPSGVTAAFGTNPTTSTSVLTFTASATATVGTSTITVTGTSGTLSHTTTISLTISSSATSQNLIVNGGFETGTATPWTMTAGVLNNSASEPAHTGAWDAWHNGYGTTHTDSSVQTVTIPSTATTANLVFWLHIDTAETTTTTAFDTFQVQVLNSANTVLATLGTFSNLNKAAGYQSHTFSVLSFKGQTVKIRFLGTEDSSLQTSFVLDDVALNVQ
ncbi:MAG: Ig family protein [Candidatus Angelobacter sp.]|nr:Ig family protein [Candidatus Angelobacter sp.]